MDELRSGGLPTSTRSLLLPTASQNFSKVFAKVTKSEANIINYVNSIVDDARFVLAAADAYSLPLVANDRCGSWYIPPPAKVGSAYFKSTDGHNGNWKFSTRRLNLQLLELVGRRNGCILVDSTKKGKSMPDAFSKSVPIWCAVMNRLIFPHCPSSHELRVPGDVVSNSEREQIVALLDGFHQDLRNLHIDVASIRKKLSLPLRPYWILPSEGTMNSIDISPHYTSMLCCVASNPASTRNYTGAGSLGYLYIQGAGDDSENWSKNLLLTPQVLWKAHKNKPQPIFRSDGEFKDVVHKILAVEEKHSLSATRIEAVEGNLIICENSQLDEADTTNIDLVVRCNATESNLLYPDTGTNSQDVIDHSQSPEDPPTQPTRRVLQLHCGSRKLGSRALRTELPRVEERFSDLISAGIFTQRPPNVLIACETGDDLAVGIALVLLCRYYDDNGKFRSGMNDIVTKLQIQRQLAVITAFRSTANPSRATLKAVNSVLMKNPFADL